jgi:hypothetical protein
VTGTILTNKEKRRIPSEPIWYDKGECGRSTTCSSNLKGEHLEKRILNKDIDRMNCLACRGSGTSYWSDDCYGSCMECCCINCEKFADECTCEDIERKVRAKLGQTYPPDIVRGKPTHLRFYFDARDDKTSNQHNQRILNLFEEEFKHKWVSIHSNKGNISADVDSEEIVMNGKGTVEIIMELIEYLN